MITLALLKLLEEAGFGKIGENLFWQKLGLGQKGLYIVNISAGGGDRQKRRVQAYEIYSVGENDFSGMAKLEVVASFLQNSYQINELPAVKNYTKKFENVAIMPPSAISNLGMNEQGRVVYSISGLIYY